MDVSGTMRGHSMKFRDSYKLIAGNRFAELWRCTMALKTYSGSCHCGAISFEADIDLKKGTTRCNCSICSKARSWFAVVSPDHYRLLTGAASQAEYEWTPTSHPGGNLHYHFCRTCGIRTVGRGEHGPQGEAFYFVAVASLGEIDADELASSIKYVDGKHDHYDRSPMDVRLL
jgi:hypothetical protein